MKFSKINFGWFCLMLLLTACNQDDNTATSQPDTSQPLELQLKDAVNKYPDSLALAESLINYYRGGGNYDQAIAAVNKQVARDSNNSHLWDLKAIIHYENGDTAKAISAYEKAVEIAADPQYLIALGTLYAETRNPSALVISDALLQSNARAEKEAWFIKGLFYSYSNEKLKAISFFDKSLSVSYTYMNAYMEKSLAFYDLGRYEESLAVLDKAIKLQNNYDESYYYRGRTLEKLKKPLEAIEAYQMALVYDPEYIEAKDALSRLGVKTN